MKKFFILSLIIISSSLAAQDFNGEILYEIRIIPKHKNLNLDSLWSTKKGDQVRYRITNSFYESAYLKEGKKTYSYSYNNVSKRMYDNYADKKYITYRDSRKSITEYYSSKMNKDSLISILGMTCYPVEYESDFGNTTSYYSEDLRIEYSSYKDHKVGNWYEKLKKVDGSLPLKLITEHATYTEIQEAVKISEIDLNASDFSLPSNKIIVASASALDKKVEMIQPPKSKVRLYQRLIKDAMKKANFKDTYKCYLSLVVRKNGEVDYIEAVEQDEHSLYKSAEELFAQSDFKFIPGQIDGNEVSSLIYFPVEFKK